MSDLEVVMMKRIGELNAEVKYLQDKVERLTAEVSYDKRVQLHVDKLAAEFTQSEVERLQAEVERLQHQIKYWQVEAQTDNARWLRCLEENERLRKAGDAIESALREMPGDYPRCLANEWVAAKEGRPNE